MTPQPQPLVLHTPPLTSYGVYRLGTNGIAPAQVEARPYFETDKIKALAVYAETGNAYEVERQTGIPHSTIGNWLKEEGGNDLVAELRSTIRYNEGWRLAKMVGKSLGLVEQALDQGDAVHDKNGRFVCYRRQNLKDLVITSSILIDKWMMISGAISNEVALMGKMTELGHQLSSLGGSLATGAPSPSIGSPIIEAPGENLIG